MSTKLGQNVVIRKKKRGLASLQELRKVSLALSELGPFELMGYYWPKALSTLFAICLPRLCQFNGFGGVDLDKTLLSLVSRLEP